MLILVVKFLIRRSIELTRGSQSVVNITQQKKIAALENVIFDAKSTHGAAREHGLASPTFFAILHRALFNIENVLGRIETPETTRALIAENLQPEDIGRILDIKPAPADYRFAPVFLQ